MVTGLVVGQVQKKCVSRICLVAFDRDRSAEAREASHSGNANRAASYGDELEPTSAAKHSRAGTRGLAIRTPRQGKKTQVVVI